MKIGILSARMQELGGFDNESLHNSIKEQLSSTINSLKTEHGKIIILTGLNLGPETWAAEIAMQFNVPYHVYIPFDKPYKKWSRQCVNDYLFLLQRASNKIVLDNGEFSVEKLRKKESQIITDSDHLMMVFPTFGFLHKSAQKQNKPITNILSAVEDDGLIGF